MIGSPDHRTASVTAALLRANLRFWPTVFPRVTAQLKRWERHASTIQDPRLRTLALDKLAHERFNAEVAATLATTAPLTLRATVVDALVAYEVLYDYLDGLTEQPLADPVLDGRRLYHPFEAATVIAPVGPQPGARRPPQDESYAECLSRNTRLAFASLPSALAVSPMAHQAASRCAEAQTRTHAAQKLGDGQLQAWAERESVGTQHSWRAFLAGSMASVLCVHALIAASSRPNTTRQEADQLDRAYLSICALSTMLDSLVDYDRDRAAGESSFLRHYTSAEELGTDLTDTTRLALEQVQDLPNASHHTMMLTGVLAYYLSAPAASYPVCDRISAPLREDLKPLLAPPLSVMRAWRAVKYIKRLPHVRRIHGPERTSPERNDAF